MGYVSILGIIIKPYFTWILVEQPPRFMDGRHLNCSWVHHLCYVMPDRDTKVIIHQALSICIFS